MASCRALRYALLALSPVSSQGICFGLEIACAAALSSPFLLPVLPFLTECLSPRGDGEGEGAILTMSARELDTKASLGP